MRPPTSVRLGEPSHLHFSILGRASAAEEASVEEDEEDRPIDASLRRAARSRIVVIVPLIYRTGTAARTVIVARWNYVKQKKSYWTNNT